MLGAASVVQVNCKTIHHSIAGDGVMDSGHMELDVLVLMLVLIMAIHGGGGGVIGVGGGGNGETHISWCWQTNRFNNAFITLLP